MVVGDIELKIGDKVKARTYELSQNTSPVLSIVGIDEPRQKLFVKDSDGVIKELSVDYIQYYYRRDICAACHSELFIFHSEFSEEYLLKHHSWEKAVEKSRTPIDVTKL